MSLVAPVEDGKIVSITTSTENAKTAGASGESMDKEAFLQLLVAQMKYQDPLQPTSNTEYISQYAQFSQVESLQNMSSNMDLQRASGLVGQTVYVKSTSASGETGYVYGKVDYVTYEGGKAYVYINENRYALEDVETVLDPEYDEAYNMALELVESINKLPNIGAIGLEEAENVDNLAAIYNGMNEYQKSFVATEKADALKAYVDKIAELRKIAEEEAKKKAEAENAENGGDEKVEGAENTEGTENTEGSGNTEETGNTNGTGSENTDGSEGAGNV